MLVKANLGRSDEMYAFSAKIEPKRDECELVCELRSDFFSFFL